MPTLGWGRQHTILPNVPKNCIKLKEFGTPGEARVPNAPFDLPLLSFRTANRSLPPQSDNTGSMRGTKAISEIVNYVFYRPQTKFAKVMLL